MTNKDAFKAVTIGLQEAVDLLELFEKELNEHGPVNPIHLHKMEQLKQLLGYAQNHAHTSHPLYDS